MSLDISRTSFLQNFSVQVSRNIDGITNTINLFWGLMSLLSMWLGPKK